MALSSFMASQTSSNASAATFLQPSQTAVWSFQDPSLANPNSIGIWGTDITPDGEKLILGERERGRIRIVNSVTGEIIRTVAVGANPMEVHIDSTGTYVWVMNAHSNSLSKVQISDGSSSTPITDVCSAGGGSMRNMVLTPNDTYAAVSCANWWSDSGTSVQIINLSDNTQTSVTNGSNPLIRLAMDPSGNHLFASTIWGQVNGAGSQITKIAIPSGSIAATFSVQTSAGGVTADGPAFLGVHGSGNTLFVASNNGVFSAWNNLDSGPTQKWASYLGHGALGNVLGPTPFVIDTSRNLGYLVYQNQGGLWPEVLDVYDLETGVRSSRTVIQHQWAASLSLSNNGEILISSGNRFSEIYKYRVGETVETTTSTAVTTTTTTTSTTTTTTTPATTTTTPATTTTTPATTTTSAAPSVEPEVNSAQAITQAPDRGQQSIETIAPGVTTTTVPSPLSAAAQRENTRQETVTTLPYLVTQKSSAETMPPAPSAQAGLAGVVVDGIESSATVTRSNNTLNVVGGGVVATVSGVSPAGERISLDADGNLRLSDGDQIVVEATGFVSGEKIGVWLFSTPAQLGSLTADATGKISGRFSLPSDVESGDHRLVLEGMNSDGSPVILGLGIAVGEIESSSTLARLLIAIPVALAIIFGLLIPTRLRRRRQASAGV